MVLPDKRYDCICRDHGYEFAKSFMINSITVNDLENDLRSNNNDSVIYVLDIYIAKKEMDTIYKLKDINPKCKFLFLIVDPWYRTFTQPCFNTYHYCIKWSLKYHNFGILSMYHIIAELRSRIVKYALPDNKCIQINYPYCDNHEVVLDFDSFRKRKHKILFSGATRLNEYKDRRNFLKHVDKINYKILKHIGSYYKGRLKHNIFGEKYVRYLSEYKFYVTLPTYFNLEFLKYSECAEAGCVPIGTTPATMPDNIIYNLHPQDTNNWNNSIRKLFTKTDEELYEMATNYRTFFKKNRNISLLKETIINKCKSF